MNVSHNAAIHGRYEKGQVELLKEHYKQEMENRRIVAEEKEKTARARREEEAKRREAEEKKRQEESAKLAEEEEVRMGASRPQIDRTACCSVKAQCALQRLEPRGVSSKPAHSAMDSACRSESGRS